MFDEPSLSFHEIWLQKWHCQASDPNYHWKTSQTGRNCCICEETVFNSEKRRPQLPILLWSFHKVSERLTMNIKMADRDVLISYIGLLKRENCQKLMLLLNNYWASAAFENAALDCRKVSELCKTIRNHSTTIINICPAQPLLGNQAETRKRCHPSVVQEESKRQKMDGMSEENQL